MRCSNYLVFKVKDELMPNYLTNKFILLVEIQRCTYIFVYRMYTVQPLKRRLYVYLIWHSFLGKYNNCLLFNNMPSGLRENGSKHSHIFPK